jgi:FkbM family methyltransferase
MTQHGKVGTALRRALPRVQQAIARSDRGLALAVRLRRHTSSVIGYRFAESGDHERNGEALFVRTVAPRCARFVDVGANVGDFTQLVLDANPAVEALLVEPGRDAGAALARRFGDRPNVSVVAAAASDAPGEAEFNEEPAAGVRSSLLPGYSDSQATTVTVRVTTIDDEVAARGWPGVDFLKIDAEGYDLHVVEGARRLLAKQAVGAVQLEYHWGWWLANRTLMGACALFDSYGYRVYAIRADGLYAYDAARFQEFGGYANFVALSPAWARDLAALVKGSV